MELLPANVDWADVAHDPQPGAARIASLVPSLTETCFALGLGAQMVARTGFCCHPRAEVRAVPRIGGTKDPDLAQLKALQPTHLLVNVDENRREVVDAARAFIPHIVVTHPLNPDDNLRLYALLGAIFARDAVAATMAAALAATLAAARTAATQWPRERVLYLIWRSPWMTVARDTYVAATLAAVGWDQVAVDPGATAPQRYPALDDADAAWRGAERILLSSEPYAFRARDVQALGQRMQRPTQLIDGEWASWYGARAIAGIAALVAARAALQEKGPPSPVAP